MDVVGAEAIINEVKAIRGFDPLRIHDENVELAMSYLPSLQYAYRVLAADVTQKRDLAKVKLKEAQKRERIHLMEKRAEGGGPVKLDVDTIKFLATRSRESLDIERIIAEYDRTISVLWGYLSSLGDANSVALSYSGRKREETKFGFGQHKLADHFKRQEATNDIKVPVQPNYNYDDEYELPDLD